MFKKSYEELVELSVDYFNQYPDVQLLYATSDGLFFFPEMRNEAASHHKHLKDIGDVAIIKRTDLEDVEAEGGITNDKPKKPIKPKKPSQKNKSVPPVSSVPPIDGTTVLNEGGLPETENLEESDTENENASTENTQNS
jgi:hypothetical protein